MKTILWVAGLLLAAGVSVAETPAAPLLIEEAWVKEAPPVARVHAAYMRITNQTENTIDITGVTATNYRMAMIHRTVDRGGMMGMEHLDALSLAPGSTVKLEPGGIHLMLMKPDRHYKAGDVIPITLNLSGGLEQRVDAVVRTAP